MKKKQKYKVKKLKEYGRNSKFFANQDFNDWVKFTQTEKDISTGTKVGGYLKYTNSDDIDYLETAFDVLNNGKHLSILSRNHFVNVIAEIFKANGWNVFISQKIHDKYLSILLIKREKLIGQIKCVLLIKKRPPNIKVGSGGVRELKSIMYETGAFKGILVTTSSFVGGALDLIGANSDSMFYWDSSMIEELLRKYRDN